MHSVWVELVLEESCCRKASSEIRHIYALRVPSDHVANCRCSCPGHHLLVSDRGVLHVRFVWWGWLCNRWSSKTPATSSMHDGARRWRVSRSCCNVCRVLESLDRWLWVQHMRQTMALASGGMMRTSKLVSCFRGLAAPTRSIEAPAAACAFATTSRRIFCCVRAVSQTQLD